jgi:hypothetical protein
MKILHVPLLVFALALPAFASPVDQQRTSAARDLAHAHSVGDQVLMGNALVRLQELACEGDPESSALLGRKYFSGSEEFQADPLKAEAFLSFAASSGVRRAAVELALHYLKQPPTTDSLQRASVWIRVGRYVDGAESPHVSLAENGIQIALANNPDVELADQAGATEAALIIHKIRNGISGQHEKPCSPG